MMHLAPGTVLNFSEILGRPLLNLSLALRILKENIGLTGTVEKALAMYNGGAAGATPNEAGKLGDQAYPDAVRLKADLVLGDRASGSSETVLAAALKKAGIA